jgi:hypothetical protein
MKSLLSQLWMWVMVLTTTTGYSQQPVMSVDSIPIYLTVKGLVPDCDRSAVAFRYYANGQWHFRVAAGSGYGLFLNSAGDAVEVSDSFALASVQDVQTNPVIKNLKGYMAGLSEDGIGGWCVSVSEKLTTFDGRFWFRINSEWAMYLRDGCLNPALVYDPAPPTPQFTVKAPPKCDTVRIHDTVRIETPVLPQLCNNCCPGDSLFYLFEPFAVMDFERIGGELERSFGFGVEWLQGRLHRNDKNDIWLEQPTSWYGGLTAYLSKKAIRFTPTCDTCGYWGDIPRGLAFHTDVFFGIQHRIFKKAKETKDQHFGHAGVFGFAEGRYDWYNSQNQRGKFLGDENIKARFGLRLKGGLPSKLPIFRSVQLEIGPQLSTYATATPNKNLAVSTGGFLELRVNLGKRDKDVQVAERHERDSIAQVKAQKQFRTDSLEMDSFLLMNPLPIITMGNALEIDTTYRDQEPQKFWFVNY